MRPILPRPGNESSSRALFIGALLLAPILYARSVERRDALQGAPPVQISEVGDSVIVTVPVGSPPVQLDPQAGEGVSVLGQPTVSIPVDQVLVVTMPQGGKISIPKCGKRDFHVTGAAFKVTLVSRSAAARAANLKRP
jgi:hypothetical protein